MFAKIEVNGENTHPLYKYLKANSIAKDLDMSHEIGSKLLSILQEKLPQNLQKNNIKWNFTKFLVDKKGEIVARFEPTYEPLSLSNIIEELI
ncbi:MAG: Hydroperoxy fatty acid reductase gpx1 [Alphaproteobacteria bacterium ADurb.Bin438]|nr:MAG: Hydroperoxy fatty acid reductase gpx1 [Alphaproteobacteria bacterium ADurb.Bin438]